VRFGGHAQAAGLTIEREKIPAFRARMNELLRGFGEECFRRVLPYDLALPFGMWTEEALSLLSRLEPTGCGNPPPAFLLRGASIRSLRRMGRDGAHLQISALDENNTAFRAVAFSQGDAADRPLTDADLLYTPYVNHFNGRTSVEARVAAIAECGSSPLP
jgi:single-stranded-DNA-specific exonuclease